MSSARASVSAPYADSMVWGTEEKMMVSPAGGAAVAVSTPADSAEDARRAWARAWTEAVSYTHLTLPTTD